MPEMELKLERPCPRCGALNGPSAARCGQCQRELDGPLPAERYVPAGLASGLPAEGPHATVACPSCGQVNLPGVAQCIDCGDRLPERAADASRRSPARPRPRPRRRMVTMKDAFAYVKLAWLMRLGSVVFLFWGVWDTASWLNTNTALLAPDAPAALRLTMFAIFELLRDMAIVAGVWLLTLLTPRQPL